MCALNQLPRPPATIVFLETDLSQLSVFFPFGFLSGSGELQSRFSPGSTDLARTTATTDVPLHLQRYRWKSPAAMPRKMRLPGWRLICLTRFPSVGTLTLTHLRALEA